MKREEFFGEVSARLTALRNKRGLTQFGLAEKAGCSPRSIQAYEGGTVLPGARILVRISEALGVDPAYFYSGEVEKMEATTELRDASDPAWIADQCRRYLDSFLVECDGRASRLGWTLEELRAALPLGKWGGGVSYGKRSPSLPPPPSQSPVQEH